MTINRKLLMAKARGFTLSIEKMNEKTQMSNAPGEYGDDYNRLLAETKKLLPELEPLLPPVVSKYGSGSGSVFTHAAFSVIHTYCEQIYQLVSESSDP